MTTTTAPVPTDDDYQPTRWDNIKWYVGYHLLGTALFAVAQRLKMLGERTSGEAPFTFQEDSRQSYDHGYRMGQRAAVRTLTARVEVTR